MFRLGIAGGLVCLVLSVLVAADEPKKPDEKKGQPLTKEKLLGKWKGPKGSHVTAIEFTQKKVILTVVAKEDGKPKTTTIEWDYEIDPTNTRRVDLLEPIGDKSRFGAARMNADGTLSVVIVEVPSVLPEGLKKVTIFTPEKGGALTKEELLGDWKGPKGSPVTALRFNNETVILTVVVEENGKPKTSTIEWGYAIDCKDKCRVYLKSTIDGGSLGSATMNADGTLSVSIVNVPPALPEGLKETTFAPEPWQPLTKEKLLGKWKGPKGSPVTAIEFTKEKVILALVTEEGGAPKAIEWDYEIDPEDDRFVYLEPSGDRGGLGSAHMNADGTLSVGIVKVPPALPKELEETKFTRVKPKDPNK